MNRSLKPSCFGNAVYNELHHFSDASEQGYGAVSYLRMINENGDIYCSFVLGKSRVTPLNTAKTSLIYWVFHMQYNGRCTEYYGALHQP